MSWRTFYHWLTTTRYTRRLEQEIEQLRSDSERLRADNDGLLRALYPAIRSIRAEAPEVSHNPKITSFKW